MQDETGDMRMHISIIMQQVTFFMAYSSLLRNAFIIPFCFLLSRGECIDVYKRQGNVQVTYFQ